MVAGALLFPLVALYITQPAKRVPERRASSFKTTPSSLLAFSSATLP